MDLTENTDIVIWSDNAVLAINKPPLLLCIPDGYEGKAQNLLSILESQFGQVWVVHRLDRETSGIVIFARSRVAHRLLNDWFANRLVKKTYHAIVEGEPDWQEKIVEIPLEVDGDRRHRTIVNFRYGKPALSEFKVIERYRNYSLIEASPLTGRRHQIRAHLAACGHPIAADILYGSKQFVYLSEIKPRYRKRDGIESPLLSRIGLHASILEVPHPTFNETMIFNAPFPKDFQSTLNQFRKYSFHP